LVHFSLCGRNVGQLASPLAGLPWAYPGPTYGEGVVITPPKHTFSSSKLFFTVFLPS
jgi:hypothetical protein